MATTYKVLGQSTPSATTATTLYTVPASTATVVSSIVICNQNTSAQTYRIAIRPAGATLAGQHYVTYDAQILAKDTHTLTLGVTLATTDVVTVYASATLLSFNAFGSELT